MAKNLEDAIDDFNKLDTYLVTVTIDVDGIKITKTFRVKAESENDAKDQALSRLEDVPGKKTTTVKKK